MADGIMRPRAKGKVRGKKKTRGQIKSPTIASKADYWARLAAEFQDLRYANAGAYSPISSDPVDAVAVLFREAGNTADFWIERGKEAVSRGTMLGGDYEAGEKKTLGARGERRRQRG